jgi:hypothetical protein
MNNLTQCFRYAKDDWSDVNFGDKRLNNRAIKIGTRFLRNPFFSPPKMLKSFKELKAFYRFMDSDKVSHEKLISPHVNRKLTEISKQKIILAVQDSTTITLNRDYEIEGLYSVGNTQGVVIQNTISIIPFSDYGIIDGLLHQIIHKRKPKEERTKDDNEIQLWTESIKAIGKPPKGTVIIDIMDRGADAAEVIHESMRNSHEFIIRAKMNRCIKDEDYHHLFELGESLPVAGQTTLEIQGNKGRKKRKAKLNISFSRVILPSPKRRKQLHPVKCNLVRIYEVDTPDNQDPLEWFLLTSLEVTTLKDALKIAKFYSYRWIIEEYHKCLKTGFRIEETQMKELRRIESLIAFISVSSVKLLQMRDIVKHDPNASALKYVEDEDVKIVKAYYDLTFDKMSIEQFLRYIAQMGGFLNRKSDGNPGWQSIWEGWKFFMGLKEGARLYKEKLMGKG